MSVNDKNSIFDHLAESNSFIIKTHSRLTGGDINEVFLLTTNTSEKFVVKLNSADTFPGMFQAEKTGLESLAKPEIIDVPKVYDVGEFKGQAYLLLEYKSSASPSPDFSELFGEQLSGLHRITSDSFGFIGDNYIGSLPQQNGNRLNAADFYISERLEPQLRMARDRNYDLELKESFFKNISGIIPDEPPALIHGDLWNGNYLVNSSGNPCLIDPAVAYAPREMDIAMMKLFGGFDNRIFNSYQQHFPLLPGFEERTELWQLYYLLVHLNLFGTGYQKSVTDIINRYS